MDLGFPLLCEEPVEAVPSHPTLTSVLLTAVTPAPSYPEPRSYVDSPTSIHSTVLSYVHISYN